MKNEKCYVVNTFETLPGLGRNMYDTAVCLTMKDAKNRILEECHDFGIPISKKDIILDECGNFDADGVDFEVIETKIVP